MPTLRELREQRGWSQAQLAARLGVAPSTIYNWEAGKAEPRLSQARAVARLLEVDLNEIQFEGRNAPE